MYGLVKQAFQHHTKLAEDEEQSNNALKGGLALGGAGAVVMSKGNHTLPYQNIYHGTAAKNKAGILREGLRPDLGGTGTDQFTAADTVFKNSKNTVHATADPGYATLFAKGFHPEVQGKGKELKDAIEKVVQNPQDPAATIRAMAVKRQADEIAKRIYPQPLNPKHSAVIRGKVPLTFIDRADFEADKYDINGNLRVPIAPENEQKMKLNAFQTTEAIPPEALKGGKASLLKKLKYRTDAIPELMEAYPDRMKKGLGQLGAGALATGAGLGLAGYGGYQYLQNREDE